MTLPPVEPDLALIDDPGELDGRDPGQMLRAVATAGAQVREALLRTGETPLDRVLADGRPRALVVAGMGGSGVAADVVASVAGVSCPVPVVAVRGYRLPGWVGPMDLVVGVSCSGRTEETITVVDEALRRGARVVTIGQEDAPLATRATGGSALHLAVDAGGRMPRANLWALSVPLLVLGDALGLLSATREALEQVADDLDAMSESCGPAAESITNPAKRLALGLEGSLPYVWGTSDIAAVAAHRFACQLAENAKYPAVDGAVPEVHHNQVVVLAGPFGSAARSDDDIFRDRVEDTPTWPQVRLVLLRDTEEVPAVAERREATSPA